MKNTEAQRQLEAWGKEEDMETLLLKRTTIQ
jgi:hypothetical protein